jgi:hypothetical protein
VVIRARSDPNASIVVARPDVANPALLLCVIDFPVQFFVAHNFNLLHAGNTPVSGATGKIR